MNRSLKQLLPMLILIVVLTAVLVVYLNPAWMQRLLSMGEPPIVEDPTEDDPPVNDPSVNDPPVDNPPIDDPPVDAPPVDDPPVDNPPIDDPPLPDTPIAPIVSLNGAYYTYDDMVADLEGLRVRYPARMRYEVYGTSADGRALYAATLGDPDAPRQVIVTAGMHAREYVNAYVLMLQLEYYLENYDTVTYDGILLSELFSRVAIVVVPMANPDGITLAQEGLEAIRDSDLKSTVYEICARLGIGERGIDSYLNGYWKSNAAGVDLNRNFDALWDAHDDGIGRPHVKNYKGSTAMSESETAALAALTGRLEHVVASLCIHSQGQIIYWRCDQAGEISTENKALAMLAASVTGYSLDDEDQTEPSYSTWTTYALHIPTITVETGISGYPQDHATMTSKIYSRVRDLWAAVAKQYAMADET